MWINAPAGATCSLTAMQDSRARIDAFLAAERPPTPCIHYRLRTRHDGGERGPVILAGPTCDSTAIIYERSHYTLPLGLEAGDYVDFLSSGAYTASYASVEFNGFPPIASHCI